MAVEFEVLNAEGKRLQEGITVQLKKLETVSLNYDEFKKNTETTLKDLGDKIDALLKGPLLSKDAWDTHPQQDDVIRKVRNDLHDNLETRKVGIERVVNLLVPDAKIPKRLTIIGITILLLMIGGYVALHKYIDTPTYKKENGEKLFAAIGKLKAHILNPEVKLNDMPDLPDFNPLTAKKGQSSNDPEKKEKGNEATGPATAPSQDAWAFVFAERISSFNGFVSVVKTGTTTGTGSVILKSQVDKMKEELEKIEKDALIFSKNDGFFWITGYWRWLEIVFWGEFGVIVGILAWICTQAEVGGYTKGKYEKELPWYIAEMVMGPVIVVAVFFLLRQFVGTFIAGVAEEDVRSSIYLTLGISFALGLFIRRTLGVFNFIKDKLPLPKE
ncbi:MAG: hypothetical protein B6D35_10370 [Candidatus Brocadia sp. UTAMX2]|nr:MAG: hypothetical protein B6D35_10370 [Candidatus Brocadia sp. UTAMX2]